MENKTKELNKKFTSQQEELRKNNKDKIVGEIILGIILIGVFVWMVVF